MPGYEISGGDPSRPTCLSSVGHCDRCAPRRYPPRYCQVPIRSWQWAACDFMGPLQPNIAEYRIRKLALEQPNYLRGTLPLVATLLAIAANCAAFFVTADAVSYSSYTSASLSAGDACAADAVRSDSFCSKIASLNFCGAQHQYCVEAVFGGLGTCRRTTQAGIVTHFSSYGISVC
jgi:hypothetical protein